MRYAFSWLMVVFLGVASPANATHVQPLLEQLIQQHPRILAAQEQLNVAQATMGEAWSRYLPSVDASAGLTYEDIKSPASLFSNGESSLTAKTMGLSVTQNIFEGFRTEGNVEVSNLTIGRALAAHEEVVQQLLLEGMVAYIDVLKQMHLSRLAKQNIQTLSQQVGFERARMENGSGIAVDVLQAQSRLQASRERHVAFTGALREAAATYQQLFDKPPSLMTMKLPKLPYQHLPRSIEAAQQMAISNHPSFIRASQEAEIARRQQKVVRANFYPTVDLVAATNRQEDSGGSEGETNSSNVGLRASWNLFTGYADDSREKQAIHAYQAALADMATVQRRVAEEARRSWHRYSTNYDRAVLLEKSVKVARQVYESRVKLRDIGNETALNVLDAESELFQVRVNSTSAHYDYYTAVFQLMFASGILQIKSLIL